MSVIGSNILAGASGQGGGYNLTKSLRFRSSASAYLNRTPASAGNRKTWTYSSWLKRGTLSVNQALYGTASDSAIYFMSSDNFRANLLAGTTAIETTQVFRDISSWYHIVLAIDTTQATSSNRVKLYVNGIQVTAFNIANYPAQNADTLFNQGSVVSFIGSNTTGGSLPLDGYLTEINFIDGQALTPSSFGETSTSTGVWIPKKYTGTYGTNGFYLPFTDTTSTSTLGTDFSGNSNTWTVNNISLTSGSTYDSMTDVPTLTSATTANYATLNPLQLASASSLSNGNLTGSNNNSRGLTSTIHVNTGKFYWEVYPTSGNNYTIGVVDSTLPLGIDIFSSGYNTCGYYTSGDIYLNGSVTTTVATYTSGDVIGVALNCDTNQVTFYKNNTSLATITLTSGISWKSFMGTGASTPAQVYSINFGQQPLTYTPPTGFVALNTFNLPTPTIGATASTTANKYMDATLYTGTGASLSVTNAGSFQPDMVWIKSRSAATDHKLTDAIRGTTKGLIVNASGAETTDTNGLTAFNSNGFTVGTDTVYNNNTATYVAWQWNAGGSNATNTSGTITSTVRANTTAGFSIATYTGNGSTGTVGHGLGVAPSMYIVKRLSSSPYDWYTYHMSLGNTKFIRLNTTGTPVTYNLWQDTTPTSSVFYLANDTGVNASSTNYVAYCFAPVAGYSAFGSYTGNGSTDGTFVFTGFRPKYVLIKRTDSTEQWYINDTSRDTYNVTGNSLRAQSSGAEATTGGANSSTWDILSNGFKLRDSGAGTNASGGTYIYMAFAENPFKYANAR